MNRLTELHQITKELAKIFSEEITGKNREQTIERIDQLIAKRSDYLKQVTPPYSEAEKKLGKEIVRLNQYIEQEMQILFHDLKKEMHQLQKQKKSNESYIHPYKNLQSLDGRFLDSKN